MKTKKNKIKIQDEKYNCNVALGYIETNKQRHWAENSAIGTLYLDPKNMEGFRDHSRLGWI